MKLGKFKPWLNELDHELKVTFWIIAIATVCKIIERRATDAIKEKLSR